MKIKLIFLITGSVVFACLLSALLDRTIIRAYADSIAIPRVKRMLYSTLEFKYTADINSLGFRDREFKPKTSPDEIRIAVLGDSFTFGWGVEENESWPRILEKKLCEKGYPAVVMNLAKPGYFPYLYAQYASIYLPALQPDIVLVGVLQGDDLGQMEHGSCDNQTVGPAVAPETPAPAFHTQRRAPKDGRHTISISGFMRTLLNTLYPHTMRARSYKSRTQTELLSSIWQRMADDCTKQFSPEESARFYQLDEKVRSMFLRGDLNPVLIQLAVMQPNLFTELSSQDSPLTVRLVQRMAQCLSAIKQSGAGCGVRSTAVLSIPYGIYACKKSYENRLSLGLQLTPAMLSDSAADTAIRLASQTAGLHCITVTDDFRHSAAKEDLFYLYDGHFNARGHAVYAGLIEPHVVKLIVQAAN